MSSNPNIHSSTAVFLFCKAPDGEGITIADVRQWLESVDRLQIPEDTEIEGALYLTLDYEDVSLSKISCSDCIPPCDHEDLLVEVPHEEL